MSEIRCKFCRRKLKDPKYHALEAGPVCMAKNGILIEKVASKNSTKKVVLEKSISQGGIQQKREIVVVTPEKQAEMLIGQMIKGSTFSGKVFSVGGFVRDDLLGKPSKDLDLVIEQKGGAQALGEFIHGKFPNETTNPFQAGADYPIWKIHFKEDVTIGEHLFSVKDVEIDLADTQKEAFPDPTSRQRITQFGSLAEDVKRRDFTANMLLRDVSTGEVLDMTGTSVSDITHGILRGHPEVSLDKIFSDDPLRMIRLVRFQAKYNWKVPFSVIKKVKANSERIKIVSQERIRDELIKVMEMGKLAKAIKFMKIAGLLPHVLPEVSAMDKVKQDRYYHSEGDVLKHTLMVTEKAKPTVIAQMSALLHDLGKPATQSFVGDRIKFLGHEDVSAKMAEEVLTRLRVDSESTVRIKKVIALHIRGHMSEDWSVKSVRKYIRDCGSELDEVLNLTEIDALSSYGPDGKPKKNIIPMLREKIKKAQEIPIRLAPVLNGEDIMKHLNIPPGKEVGLALSRLKEIEDDYAEKGLVLTKENAIEELKRKNHE